MPLVMLLVLMIGAQVRPPQARDARTDVPSGTAVIRGRVTDAESAAPVPRVKMTLALQSRGWLVETTTDAKGAFEFAGLAAGDYVLSADPTRGTTHRPATYGPIPGKPLGKRALITIADGEVFEKADIALQRSYVISGRVFDEDGEPVPDVRVEAETVGPHGVEGTIVRSRTTDDRGSFRLWGYAPGTYRVCAVPLSAGPDQRSAEGLIRTCYPSGPESEAEPVVITTADPPELHIHLRRSRLFRISGVVLDASGGPAPNAIVSFVTVERYGGSSRTLQNEGGAFSIRGVVPGEYAIRAEARSQDHSDDSTRERGFAPVTVQSADVDNLVVTMEKPVTVAGRIVFDGGTPSGVRKLTVRAEAPQDNVVMRMSAYAVPSAVKADLSFEVRGLSGAVTLVVEGLPGWVIKSVRYRGEERAGIPTEFRAGPESAGLEIVMTNRTASLAARVLDERGQPTDEGHVVVFPADPRQWGVMNATRTAYAKDGTFGVQGLRAGDYYVVGLGSGTYVPSGSRRALEQLSKIAERITLLENDQRTVDLVLRK